MPSDTLYAQVEKKRKNWTPVAPTQMEECVPGAADTLSRCFSLRFLEIPVKEFILDALSRKDSHILGEEGRASLLRNTLDEEKHDTALNNCVKVFADYNASYENEAMQLLKAWNEAVDHPLVKTAVLENGIFFVILPIYRQFGGSSLRTTAVDISADEVNHVQLHRYASKVMGYKPSRSLDNLRKATVDWLIDKFEVEGYDKERFRRASDSLMYKGVTDELDFTRSYMVPAFFEKRNDQLPYYN